MSTLLEMSTKKEQTTRNSRLLFCLLPDRTLEIAYFTVRAKSSTKKEVW